MLDKSLPFVDFYMRLSAEKLDLLPAPVLPQGYRFVRYVPGNAADWCRIETSVLEFSGEDKAAEYFGREFFPFEAGLAERMVFVLDPAGLAVATATAWYRQMEEKRHNLLHWIAVCPQRQKLGLGRAVVTQALRRFVELDQAGDVYLHTQTWSYPAIALYHSLGFVILKKNPFTNEEMPYEKGLDVLSQRLSDGVMDSLRSTLE